MKKKIAFIAFLGAFAGCNEKQIETTETPENDYFVQIETTFPNQNSSEFGESIPFKSKSDSTAFLLAFNVWEKTKSSIDRASEGKENSMLYMKATNFRLLNDLEIDITKRVEFVGKDSLLNIVKGD